MVTKICSEIYLCGELKKRLFVINFWEGLTFNLMIPMKDTLSKSFLKAKKISGSGQE